MKRFIDVLIVVSFLIPLAVLCVPAYYGVLALSVPSARAEFLNHWALEREALTGPELDALDQVERYHPANCQITVGTSVYGLPLPSGATPFESELHPRQSGRSKYLVRTAPFEAWCDDLALKVPDGFSFERLGSTLHFTSADGRVSVIITDGALARVYTLLEVSACDGGGMAITLE